MSATARINFPSVGVHQWCSVTLEKAAELCQLRNKSNEFCLFLAGRRAVNNLTELGAGTASLGKGTKSVTSKSKPVVGDAEEPEVIFLHELGETLSSCPLCGTLCCPPQQLLLHGCCSSFPW
ncbi:hypothetical protein EK904_011375 [Melospiza melodia maxima]|nr:hypothetical protein EK904_011375 [Melospiza melodia maxima]